MGNSNKLKNGINFLPAYQMPGLPFVTSSVAGEVPCVDTFNLRVKSIFLLSNSSAGDNTTAANSTDFSLIAGLSTIAASEYHTLTGSVNGVDGWQGVG